MLTLREAAERDFAGIARLHAESWRSAYRGMLSDEYLDHRVHLERTTLWQQRFSERAEKPFFVILAEVEKELAGFGCVFPDEHPTYGAFLDNLHVVPQRTGQGIGRRLLSAIAERLLTDERRGGLYLWVIEQNARRASFMRGPERWKWSAPNCPCRMVRARRKCAAFGPAPSVFSRPISLKRTVIT